MHIHINEGVIFSKFKSWENDLWRTLVAFWPTVRRPAKVPYRSSVRGR